MIEVKRNRSQISPEARKCHVQPVLHENKPEVGMNKSLPYGQFEGRTAGNDNGQASIRAAVLECFNRHNPPHKSVDNGCTYWTETLEDMNSVARRFDNDPAAIALLVRAYEELDKRYKILYPTQK